MSDARHAILGAICKTLGRTTVKTDTVAQDALALLADTSGYQPKFVNQSNRDRFIERATSERLTATVDEVNSINDVPGAVRDYLMRCELPLDFSRPPMTQLRELDWGDVAHRETLSPDEPVVVNLADWAIAETGTLVFTSRPDSPTLYNFLPLHHIILLDASKILRYPEEYWQHVRSKGNVQPRSINFVTGTSGTADIEAINIRGAHGPRFMHLVIFGL
jgi:L-lactate dehydrogenase complex protein LldG